MKFYDMISNIAFILSVISFVMSMILNDDILLYLCVFLMLMSDLSSIMYIKYKIKDSDNK